MRRETRLFLILVAVALVLVALGQLVYRSGLLVEDNIPDPPPPIVEV